MNRDSREPPGGAAPVESEPAESAYDTTMTRQGVDPSATKRARTPLGEPGRIEGFVLEHRVGHGGMGVVYRARAQDSEQPVAIKLLEHDSSVGIDVDRFFREANILADLRHPAIVGYVTHGRTDVGHPFLAMEWLEGEDLRSRLQRGPLPIDEAVHLAIRVAEALSEAHAHGLVHRDLKPANVFLPDGQVEGAKLLDFGIARPARDGPSRLTQTGLIIGTPAYMAPELLRGAAHIDARADLFGLGCLLYECLVGRPVFSAEHVLGVLARVLFEDPPHAAAARGEVPPALDALVTRLLAKSPHDRPDSASAVAEMLRALFPLAPGMSPTTTAPVLSASEQLVVSVVLVGLPEGEFDEQLQTVARHGGTSLERVTDSTLITALAPGPAVDQAAAAARLGLALRAVVPQASIAVGTGRAVMAGVLPVGDAIDRAARLTATGEPGVWLDDVTTALLEGRFDIAQHGRLVRERAADEAARTLLGKPTPCVGREHELTLLDAALAEAVARPAARAIVVTAPAGVGKSRLAFEWMRRLGARAEPPRVLTCRGEPTSLGTPFLLAAQLVRRGTGVVEAANAAEQVATLNAALADRVAASELPRLVTFLGELLGIDDIEPSEELRAARASPLLMGDQLRLAWEDWLHCECASGPLVLVIEDLHWGDAPSVNLLGAAMRSLSDQALLVVALGRPELHELFPRLWAERGTQEIRLAELSRQASEELARAALGSTVDTATVAWIGERAGGHALYLEEVIRAVSEGERARVPESVLAMVQARMAALSAEARRLLRAASIFGEVFWRGGVATLLGCDEGAVAPLLEDLTTREAISRHRVSRFPGETEFAFRHALFREAAEAMLTDADRALGHRLVARWLQTAGERRPLVLADHLERCGEGAEAAGLYLDAAEEALLGNDFAGAIERARRGLALDAAGVTGRLRLVESEALSWLGDAARAERGAVDALELLPARSAAWYAAYRVALARLPAPRELLDDLIGRLGDPPEPLDARRGFVMAAVAAARQLSFHGAPSAASDLVQLAETATTALPAADIANAWTLRARASVLEFEGRHDAALAARVTAAAQFEAIGDLREACSLNASVGWLQATELGMHDEAVQTLQQLRVLAQRMGLAGPLLAARQNLGAALMRLGRLDEAQAFLEETIGGSTTENNPRMEAGSRYYLILLHSVRRDWERAESEAQAALALVADVPTTRACVLAASARALLGADRAGEALDRARTAAEILDHLSAIEEGEALIRVAHAEALHANGAVTEARAAITAAAARLRERADLIEDANVRRCFLEEVPEHARTAELARQWSVAPNDGAAPIAPVD